MWYSFLKSVSKKFVCKGIYFIIHRDCFFRCCHILTIRDFEINICFPVSVF